MHQQLDQPAAATVLIDEPAGPPRDTLFGICQSAGEDIGVNPFFLRVALLVLLLISPAGMIAAYLGLGALVAITRLLYPDIRPEDLRPQAHPRGPNRAIKEPQPITG